LDLTDDLPPAAPMTGLDWAIVVFALILASWGYQQGLIVGALTLSGFVAGAFIGGRLAPAILERGSESPYAPLVAAGGALLLGAVVAVGVEEFAHGLRTGLVRGPLSAVVDGLGGAALVGAVALGLVWVFGAVALHTPGAGELRREVQRSAILRSLNEVFPPSGPILHALNRIDPGPAIAGPPAAVGPPGAAILRDPQARAAGRSVVKVLGTACGLAVEGSGWVAGPGLVVTNAHVVAGQTDTTVTTAAGTRVGATAHFYDPRNDLALLSAPVQLAPLPIAPRARRGEPAAVLGYPENGPLTVTAARAGSTRTVISNDSYGRGPLKRRMTSFRGTVRSGNSGGPVVSGDGSVLGTVFAATTNRPSGGFAIPNGVVREAVAAARGPVDTGPCTR
jgi:S1-C subfamily serine protease